MTARDDAVHGQALRAVMREPVLFDGRNLYDPALMRELGFEYVGIGRPGQAARPAPTTLRGQALAA